MINIKKSDKVPKCLSHEKKKKNGDYKCGEVLHRIQDDFFNKCYLCEEKNPSTINVEHFRPHKGNKDLKFDWRNLYYSCGHCNNTKLDKYDSILDCTDFSRIITDLLKFEISPFPYEKADIKPLSKEDDVVQTAQLLNDIYNGTTVLKTIEAENKRNKLIKEIIYFNDILHHYFEPGLSIQEKEIIKSKIKQVLNVDTPFTAFKIWIIKKNRKLNELFGMLIPKMK